MMPWTTHCTLAGRGGQTGGHFWLLSNQIETETFAKPKWVSLVRLLWYMGPMDGQLEQPSTPGRTPSRIPSAGTSLTGLCSFPGSRNMWNGYAYLHALYVYQCVCLCVCQLSLCRCLLPAQKIWKFDFAVIKMWLSEHSAQGWPKVLRAQFNLSSWISEFSICALTCHIACLQASAPLSLQPLSYPTPI